MKKTLTNAAAVKDPLASAHTSLLSLAHTKILCLVTSLTWICSSDLPFHTSLVTVERENYELKWQKEQNDTCKN